MSDEKPKIDLSEEHVDIGDLPTIALLDIPYHNMDESEMHALVTELRGRRVNAAATKAKAKNTSDKIAGKKPKKSQLAFKLDDLLQ